MRVNCGALSESLLESELFGHVRGSFTGAINNRTGRFEAAHTGTIFLDEINSTTPKLQVKLLRVLQEREFERVGDTQTIRVDTRVIAASNRDLSRRSTPTAFARICTTGSTWCRSTCRRCASGARTFPSWSPTSSTSTTKRTTATWSTSRRARLEALQDYDWPGNVRELQNYVERAVVMAPGDELTLDLLPDAVLGRKPARTRGAETPDLEALTENWCSRGWTSPAPATSNLHNKIVNRVERELIVQVMSACDSVQIKAAARLGINRNTLHKKLKEYHLEERNGQVEPPG